MIWIPDGVKKPSVKDKGLSSMKSKFSVEFEIVPRIALWLGSHTSHNFPSLVWDNNLNILSTKCNWCNSGFVLTSGWIEDFRVRAISYAGAWPELLHDELLKWFSKGMGADCPHTLPSLPEPLTDNDLDKLVDWLNDPTNWESHQRVIIHFDHLPDIIGENIDPAGIKVTWAEIKIQRHRLQVNDRWWVDIATREDTGEPVLTVNHEGSFEEFRKNRKQPNE